MRRRVWLPLLIVAAVGMLLGNVASWLEINLVDSSRFVSTTTDVLEQEDVRQAIADRIVERLLEEKPLVAAAAGDQIEAIVAGILGTDRFQALLTSIATQFHEMLVTGDHPTITIESPVLQLLIVAVARVVAPEQAADLQIDDEPLVIELFARRDVPSLEQPIRVLRWTGLIASVIALGAMAIVILRSDDRHSAVRRCGITVVVAGVLLLVVVPAVRIWMVGKVENASQETIVREFITAFTVRLAVQTGLLVLIGWVMIAYGYRLFAKLSAPAPDAVPSPIVEHP
ncbi:MAG TPA: hypothetical protein VFV93_14065 [Thermomicrobiales bacterium]|nr:hypothetical protein [Thermomicrobiales bacterium]